MKNQFFFAIGVAMTILTAVPILGNSQDVIILEKNSDTTSAWVKVTCSADIAWNDMAVHIEVSEGDTSIISSMSSMDTLPAGNLYSTPRILTVSGLIRDTNYKIRAVLQILSWVNPSGPPESIDTFYSHWVDITTTIIDTSVGVMFPKSTNIMVYPNPATTQFTIMGVNDHYMIYLYDSLGKLVMKGSRLVGDTEPFQVERFLPGVYSYQVVTNKDNRVQSGRLIVLSP